MNTMPMKMMMIKRMMTMITHRIGEYRENLDRCTDGYVKVYIQVNVKNNHIKPANTQTNK